MTEQEKQEIEYQIEQWQNSDDPMKEKNIAKLREQLKNIPKWNRRTAADILNTDYPSIRWVVENIIPEGLTKIDGTAKIGKSWLALHLATAISSGGRFMGTVKVEQQEVLYLALEDSERRLKNRIEKQNGIGNEKLIIETAASWKGGIATLQKYLKEYPNTGLVIIDTLFMFNPIHDPNSYAETYKSVSAIQRLSTETEIPIVIIHHTRKGSNEGSGESWANEGMGSQGINGAVDTIILLKKPDGKDEGTMRIKGRDIEESCYKVIFDKDICTWRITGQGDIVRALPKAQADVLAILEAAGENGIQTREIAEKLSKSTSAVIESLNNLLNQSKAKKLSHGVWAISDDKEDSELNNPELVKLRNSDSPRQPEFTEFEKPDLSEQEDDLY